MATKFVEIPVHEKTYRKSGLVRNQMINIDYIIRFFPSDNHEFVDETFLELSHGNDNIEIIRTTCSYDQLKNIIFS